MMATPPQHVNTNKGGDSPNIEVVKIRFFVIMLIALLCTSKVFAQYFETGSTSNAVRWSEIERSEGTILFPSYFYPKATMVKGYLDTVTNVITYGLNNHIEKTPIVIQPLNARANGLVTWAPSRMELYTTPADELGTLPWLKQLTVHEYRHVVQMSNLDVGFTNILSYILGEQAVGVVAAVVPGWFLEGDAVTAETQLAINGRGKQPEFSIVHRAMLNEDPKSCNYDKWKGGSLNSYTPSTYELGYWPVLYGETFYDPNIWGEMLDYCGHNPIVAAFTSKTLKKKYGKGTRKILYESYDVLSEFWHDASNEPNSPDFIPSSYRYYEEHSNLVMLDSTTVLSHGYNMNKPNSLFQSNITTGEQRQIEVMATKSSPYIVKDNRIYWTEYKPSLFWEQESSSLIRYADITQDKSGAIKLKNHQYVKNGDSNTRMVTALDNDMFAYISYDKLSNPSIVVTDSSFNTISRDTIAGWDSAVSSMCYDNLTKQLYLFLIDNRGLSLQAFNPTERVFTEIKAASQVSQRQLTASNGKLYFTSTASGKDENHIYDLLTGQEWQSTSSQYGSFSPTPAFELDGDTIQMVASYRLRGYALAKQSICSDSLKEVAIEYMPNTRLHPSWHEWDVMKIDTIDILPESTLADNAKHYNKLSHLINPHSWMPITLDIDNLINNQSISLDEIGIGATVVSQNLLGDFVTSVGYGYIPTTDMTLFSSSFRYTGFPFHLEVGVDYGGTNQYYYYSNSQLQYNSIELEKRLSADFTLSLPMNLSDGRSGKYLTPYIQYNYSNDIFAYGDFFKYSMTEGFNKLDIGVSWQDVRYSAYRDIKSQLGYYLSLRYATGLDGKNFGRQYSLYAISYLPGLFTSHSLSLASNIQYQKEGTFNFSSSTLYPRGNEIGYAPEQLYAFKGEYQLPLAYPDGGIPNVIYFKRIALGVFGEYASNYYFTTQGTALRQPYTYGAEIMLDYTVISSSTGVSTGISLYKPSEQSHPMVGISFSIDI